MARSESTNRKAAQNRGRFAEALAAIALQLKGWRIEERNFRCRGGEIDIVARKGNLIAFVEVKARSSIEEALHSVGPQTRQRVAAAGREWIARRRDQHKLSWRHDIVAVRPMRWPVHLPDAF
jgi:putative endonuclease